MDTFFKKTSLICIFVLIELLLLWFFNYSLGAYIGESGQSFNAFLNEYGGYQFFLAAYSKRLLPYGLLAYFTVCIFIVGKELGNPCFLSSLNQLRLSRTTIFLNILSFLALLGILIGKTNPVLLISNPYSWQSIFYTINPLIWAVYLFTICNAIFPIKEFLKLGIKNKVIISIILLGIFFLSNPEIMDFLINFWANLLLVPTIQLASGISRVFHLDYRLLPDLVEGLPAFGTRQFEVEIAPACAGYEGMSLIILLLGGYCFIQNKILNISKSLLILPIAGLMMFLLNGLRIFLLVAIGHYWSPQLAIDGFHSVAGWLNLLVTLILALFILNLPFFQKEQRARKSFELGDTALLIPLMSLIIVSLLTKVVTPDFSWLYPVHIVVASLVLYCFRKPFRLFVTRPSTLSIAIGVLVFILWIVLIPENQEQSAHFVGELDTGPLWLSLIWLLFRVMGASVIVPIAEEFAFRGYIQPHLECFFEQNGFKYASVIASLGISALLFGYVHSNMLAGSVAGLFFGLAYLQRRQLMDAVIAHAVTNALLAGYVMGFGYWSYW